MRLELDDPRLMDYVLGELEDGEALDVAAALELDENKDARELVEELRGVADTARRVLHEEDGDVALSDEQRAAIVGTVPTKTQSYWRLRRPTVFQLAAAALFVIVGFSILTPNLARYSSESLAYRMAPSLGEGEPDVSVELETREAYSPSEHKLPQHTQSVEISDPTSNSDDGVGTLTGELPEPPFVWNDPESKGEDSKQFTLEERRQFRVEEFNKYGKLYQENGLPDQAEAIYSHILELDPNNQEAKDGLEQASRAKAAEFPEERQASGIAADSDKIQQFYDNDGLRPGNDFKGIEIYPFTPPPGDEQVQTENLRESAVSIAQAERAPMAEGAPPEQPARLGLKNEFAQEPVTYIEYDSYHTWGDTKFSTDTNGNGIVSQAEEAPMVEARNRLEMKANLSEGLSLSYETEGDRPAPAESAPPEEHWAEYNVGNLTGQTALPEQVASNVGIEPVSPPNNNLWQWSTPAEKATEIVGGPGAETYVKVAGVKPFLAVKDEPLSTFSIDVDTAAYSNVRRFLTAGQLPPADAVRIEEMVNYFRYAYAQPVDGRPFAVSVMGAPAPWAQERQLVRIGIKGKEVPQSERPQANLVFLIDASGSMSDANKLPLVKESMKTLLSQLRPTDRVGIVTYSGDARLVLGSTPCSEAATITQAIDSLQPSGGTNGGGGIQMAYDLAQSNFNKEGINRVIMATDGDFNVGATSHGDLMGLIEARAKSGVFLTTLGFGMGNLKDSTLEQLANRGNGNYAYIDNHAEARKALVDQLSGTLQTIAKDVKIQVEFNPARVSHYRLLGYENRALANQDFNDDTKDAGEIGAGHTVTALYEVIPTGGTPVTGVDALKYQSTAPGVDPLKYQEGAAPASTTPDNFQGEERIAPEPMPLPQPVGEWLTVKMRYKEPQGTESTKIDVPLLLVNGDLRETDADFRFASAVAAFGQVLRNPGYRHPSNFDRIVELARGAAKGDADREAFVDLVITAKTLINRG